MMQPNYDPIAVKPMEEELEKVRVQPLKSGSDVDRVLTQTQGTVLLVVNSVCGCAAGSARPGVMRALQHKTIPDKSVTVFAGMDHEAVQRARGFMPEIPPSSPCIALFKEGKLAFILERYQIEQMNVDLVAESLIRAFDEHCSTQGPSIPTEEFAKITAIQQCGSSIPLFGQS